MLERKEGNGKNQSFVLLLGLWLLLVGFLSCSLLWCSSGSLLGLLDCLWLWCFLVSSLLCSGFSWGSFSSSFG